VTQAVLPNGRRVLSHPVIIDNEIALVDQNGNRNSFSYNATDSKTLELDPLSRRTTLGYDIAGRQDLRIDARRRWCNRSVKRFVYFMNDAVLDCLSRWTSAARLVPHQGPISMSRFDPYHQWLGIHPEDRPVDCYKLLGIDCFEADVDLIHSAAKRQMDFVREFAAGEHADAAQRLLNELGKARYQLVDEERKAKYDRKLKKLFATEIPKPVTRPDGPLASPASDKLPAGDADRPAVRKSKGGLLVASIVIGVVAAAAGFYVFQNQGEPNSEETNQQVDDGVANVDKQVTASGAEKTPDNSTENPDKKKPLGGFEQVAENDGNEKPKPKENEPTEKPTVPVAKVEIVKLPGSVDLLAKIDLKRDQVEGDFTIRASAHSG
jgi:hypothetical protein